MKPPAEGAGNESRAATAGAELTRTSRQKSMKSELGSRWQRETLPRFIRRGKENEKREATMDFIVDIVKSFKLKDWLELVGLAALIAAIIVFFDIAALAANLSL